MADVSLPMLEFARQKAKNREAKNIEFHNAGFLTYEHSGERVDAETAVREEYSTQGQIMEGLLERAGFHIDNKEYSEGFMAVYVCTRR